MNQVFGELLPLALGVAISPVPIIAVILMLLSPKARATSLGFLLGWVVGIIVTTVIFTLLTSLLPDPDDVASKPIQGVVQLVIGVLLLVLAVGQWRKRPRVGQEPDLPKWMHAIDKVTFPAAAGLGLLLSAVNPKNLLMTASAGISIGSAALPVAAMIGALAVFTVVAASTVGVPVVAFLVASQRLRAPLDALRVWLGRENAVIMAVLLLIIGVTVLGNGISSL